MTLLRDLEANKAKSEFLQRVASIPVVYFAWNIATDAYNCLKNSNKLLNFSLTTTEKAAHFISSPFVKRLEKPLKFADRLACRGLETLEGIVPRVRYHQEKFYRQTIGVYTETVESGIKKYTFIRNLSSSKLLQFMNEGTQRLEELSASPYGEVCDLVLDIVFGAGEIYVDYYLPPLGDERPEKVFGDRGKEPKWKRAELLRNRIKERLYKHTLLKIQRVRLQTKVFVTKVSKFSLYEYVIQVSSTIPGAAYAAAVHVFSNIEDMVLYLVSLFMEQVEDDSMV